MLILQRKNSKRLPPLRSRHPRDNRVMRLQCGEFRVAAGSGLWPGSRSF